jgi:hypothetical protein
VSIVTYDEALSRLEASGNAWRRRKAKLDPLEWARFMKGDDDVIDTYIEAVMDFAEKRSSDPSYCPDPALFEFLCNTHGMKVEKPVDGCGDEVSGRH